MTNPTREEIVKKWEMYMTSKTMPSPQILLEELSSDLALLEKSIKEEVVEWAEGQKAEEYELPAQNLGGAAHNTGYNQALSDLKSYLTKEE